MSDRIFILVCAGFVGVFCLAATAILFRWLKSTAAAESKSTYRLGGAAAGFVVIWGLATTFVLQLMDRLNEVGDAGQKVAELQSALAASNEKLGACEQEVKDRQFRYWTVVGRVKKGNSQDGSGVTVKQIPSTPTIATDESGQFRLENVRLAAGGWPEIYFSGSDVFPKELSLGPDNAERDDVAGKMRLREDFGLALKTPPQ